MSEKEKFTLPDQGFVFWPVGNGDSTTIRVSEDVVIQVDLCACEDEGLAQVVDRLVESLPQKDGKPYLAAFVLTHPDRDHCLGFRDLKAKVTIGELWHTPRIFREYSEDLCDDAVAFRKEASRRAKVMIDKAGQVESGDRLRLVGWDEILEEDKYKGFPKSALSIPGTAVEHIDGVDLVGVFRGFIHGPFKDDCDGDRNDTSLAMQVTLSGEKGTGKVLLLGDLCYPTVKRILELSEADDLAWDVLVAPHHCSKSVMYWKAEGEDQESLRREILDGFEKGAGNPGTIISSSIEIPASNEPGDNPPHAVAKARYEGITATFLCTGDDAPTPIIFTVAQDGLSQNRQAATSSAKAAANLLATITAARGADEPPRERVGFGRE